MEVTLPPEMERLVTEKVASGSYNSPTEVLCHALLLLQDQDVVRAHRLEALRREVAIGIEAADRGDLVDGEEFFDTLLREIEQDGQTESPR